MSSEVCKEEKILQRLKEVEKEFKRKKRKLERSRRSLEAKAYVRKRIAEESGAGQQEKTIDAYASERRTNVQQECATVLDHQAEASDNKIDGVTEIGQDQMRVGSDITHSNRSTPCAPITSTCLTVPMESQDLFLSPDKTTASSSNHFSPYSNYSNNPGDSLDKLDSDTNEWNGINRGEKIDKDSSGKIGLLKNECTVSPIHFSDKCERAAKHKRLKLSDNVDRKQRLVQISNKPGSPVATIITNTGCMKSDLNSENSVLAKSVASLGISPLSKATEGNQNQQVDKTVATKGDTLNYSSDVIIFAQEKMALKNSKLSVSKYKKKNYIAKTSTSEFSPVFVNGDPKPVLYQPNAKPVTLASENSESRIPVVKDNQLTELGDAQAVIFERQVANLSKSQRAKTATKEQRTGKARKPRESSDRAIMRELDKNLVVGSDMGIQYFSSDKVYKTTDLEDLKIGKDSGLSETVKTDAERKGASDTASEGTIESNSECYKVGSEPRKCKPIKRQSSGPGEANRQRRSFRIAEHSSQSNHSDSTDIPSPVCYSTGGRRSGNSEMMIGRKSRKSVLMTSLFQYLIDEGKRKREPEDFSLPDEFLDICLNTDELNLDGNLNDKINERKYLGTAAVNEKEDLDTVDIKSKSNDVETVNSVNDTMDEDKRISGFGELTKTTDTRENETVEIDLNENRVDRKELDTSVELEVANFNQGSKAKREYSISPIVLTTDRPGDQCVSANSSKLELSPILFESQNDPQPIFTFHKTSKPTDESINEISDESEGIERCEKSENCGTCESDNDREKVDNCKCYAEVRGICKVKHMIEGLSSEKGDASNVDSSQSELPDEGSEKFDMDDQKAETVCLKQIASFQLCPGSTVQCMMCVEVRGEPYITCLSQSQLSVYSNLGNQWSCLATHRVKCNMRKKSGQMLHGLLDCDRLCIVMKENQSNSTALVIYFLHNDELQRLSVASVHNNSVVLCPLFGGSFVVSCYKDWVTTMTKYTEVGVRGKWRHQELDRVDRQITGLNRVQDLPAALLALTNTGLLYIWNHEHGFLLSTIDLCDICPSDPVCPLAFNEQGYLLLPVLSRRKQTAGCVLVVNPHLGVAETLLTLDQTPPSHGCSSSHVMSDLLVVKTNSGIVRLYDLLTGGYLATVDDVTVTCLSTTNHILAMGHKNCIHVYALR